MKKLLLQLTICTVSMFSLIGCASINEHFEDQMVRESGILEDPDYLVYEEYAEEGKLDEDGYYAEVTDIPVEEQKPIHVTFSDNNNLHIQYYSDAAHHEALDPAACYLDPGDQIYAVVQIDDDIFSSTYEFAGFRVLEDDDQENMIETSIIGTDGMGSECVLSIPLNYQGTEVSVVPTGTYQKRTIALKDYCSDDNGGQEELSGTWVVNDKEYTGDSVEISAASSYIISYQYDSNEYFYMSSEPECYYNNNTDGVVIFKQRDPSDATLDYSVELHRYIEVSLVSDMDRLVSINGEERQSVSANSELIISKLRYGQPVVISTDKEWPDLENCRELILTSSGKDSGYFKYNMIVPEKDGEFLFDPSEYQYEHGTVSFTCFGSVVTSPQVLAKGSKIYYSQGSADDGYWLTSGDNFVIVSDEASTKQQLMDIHFTQKVQVMVALEQPQYGGTVTYRVDGDKLYGDTYSTYSGTVIEMEFIPWEGWILNNNAKTGDTYIVKNDKSQTVRGNGYAIRSVFTEDKNHKPAMTVTLEKSVGSEMEFSISASGFNSAINSYGGGWKVTDVFNKEAGKYNIIENSQEIITQQKIGTEAPIVMTMGNRALQSGQAVRFIITKTDSADNKVSETRYITNMTSKLEPIYIYEPDELATAKTWYKSIHITIGVVGVERFSMPSASANTTISVRNGLTDELMSDGELIEGSEKVTLRINPDAGYYVTGKKVTNGVYQETMKYSDYLKNVTNIITQHPAAKYYTITLDNSDTFAEYSYELDGKAASGIITAKEGQKLSLTYEITDAAYKLEDAAGGIPFVGWGKSYTKVSKDLIITSEMDGRIITKDDFGISVKGEE